MTPIDAFELPCPSSKGRAEEFSSSQDHGPTVVPAMDHGELVTACLFIFLHCTVEEALFATYKGVFQGLEEEIFSNNNLILHLLVRV